MSNPEQFTACPENPQARLEDPRTIFRSSDDMNALKKRLSAQRRFWTGRFMDAVQEGQGRDMTVADIMDPRRAQAAIISGHLTAVINDIAHTARSHPLPVATRGLSLLGMSHLYRHMILTDPSAEVSPNVLERERGVLVDAQENLFGYPEGYAMHVDPALVSGHFEEGALPALLSEEKWCAIQGLYISCVRPATPSTQLVEELARHNEDVDFPFMMTIKAYPGSTPDM